MYVVKLSTCLSADIKAEPGALLDFFGPFYHSFLLLLIGPIRFKKKKKKVLMFVEKKNCGPAFGVKQPTFYHVSMLSFCSTFPFLILPLSLPRPLVSMLCCCCDRLALFRLMTQFGRYALLIIPFTALNSYSIKNSRWPYAPTGTKRISKEQLSKEETVDLL